MKVPETLIAPLLIPFAGLSSNFSGSSEANRSIAAAPTYSFSAPAATASSHHHHHHHHRERAKTHLGLEAGDTRHAAQRSEDCPASPVLSCSTQAQSTSSCCVIRPGGVLVHAQFWDVGYGVANSWGIHGLWPDLCNNKYYESCDSSRDYSGSQIASALQSAGDESLYEYMNTYWVSNDESPEDFWAHEWSTHGTCVSTLEPSCFASYTTGQEVVPYFSTVVGLFKQLDTYNALAAAGITPSSDETYSLDDMQNAVEKATGMVPDFTCSDGTVTTVMYYLNAEGPLQDGQFVQSHASRSSSCPSDGITYPVKTVGN
ncbi:ribonuclease T2 [Heliocybe sulcata]|uniref:ribonuclease T2 n=1 Tax=Heliocybe sulcata TaxID=5364 RepID=A0A5C3MMX6_9AGAM|nr:ribonuclease T2 [Heliocybe sulcata]